MKIIDKYILRSYILPFVAVLAVVVFILMMQFLWLYIDELVGKGLGIGIILEFLGWGCVTILPLALPLATLLSSVMTLGALGEHFELMAIKAAGISLSRILAPIAVVNIFISAAAFYISNEMIPVAYEKIYTLRDDILRTKEEIKIPKGSFYDGIDGYVLRIDDRNDKSNMMYGVMVYNHTSNKGNISLTLADSAMMTIDKNKTHLSFTLYNGSNYEEKNEKNYRDTTLELQHIEFDKQQVLIPIKNYGFQKSDSSRFGDEVKAMPIRRLRTTKDSLSLIAGEDFSRNLNSFRNSDHFRFEKQLDTARTPVLPADYIPESGYAWANSDQELNAVKYAKETAENMNMSVMSFDRETYFNRYILRLTDIELLKKLAVSVACFLFFLIGSSVGAVIRKGGIGTPAIIGVLFFVLYWVVDITGTKLARDGKFTPFFGVYISTLVLLPISIFLTNKAVHDSAIINMDSFKVKMKLLKTKFLEMFKKTRIVYMGTPEFAVAPLEALLQKKYNVVGVVTVADKQSGRGLKVNESAVKKYAVAHNIPVLQPTSLKDPEFLEQLAAFKADIFVVVAFRMLPEVVWTMPKLGTFNLHAALLPQYRGAAPINWALINGEKTTGVTTFMIDHGIDTGRIIYREQVRIAPEDNAGTIHDKLMQIGASLVVNTVETIMEGNKEFQIQKMYIQGSEKLKPAPKLTRELCHIDFDDTTRHVHDLVRGLSPYPAAFTELEKDGKIQQMKIYATEPMRTEEYQTLLAEKGLEKVAAGTLLSDGKHYLAIATADGAVKVLDLQLAGKKRMDVKSFLIGFRNPESYRTTAGTSKEFKSRL